MDKPFKEIIIDAIEHKGLSIGKLAELSRVPEHYVELIIRGDYEKLPSSPYLHGYFTRLSETLNLESELVWQVFKKEFDIRTSGEKDLLPKNRFAFEPINNTKIFTISSFVVLVFVYLIFRFNALFGKPYLVVLDPAESNISTNIETYVLRGNAELENKLSINNELVDIKEDGSFEKSVLLQEGVNTFEIKTKKFLGRETSVSRQIIFEKVDSSPSSSETENENSPDAIPSE